MLFGKHINKYYLRYLPVLLLGLLTLAAVDVAQLILPSLYRITVNGILYGTAEIGGETVPFDMDILLDQVCLPLIIVAVIMLAGRFLWRVCFIGSARRTETRLRAEMFDHCKDLSQKFYDENKVGNMMSLFTNDLETIQDSFGFGVMMAADAVILGSFAVYRMANMHLLLTLFALVPLAILGAISTVVGKAMTRQWDKRQEVFSEISDRAQESFSGISVIKAFVRETRELISFSKLNQKNEDANVQYTRYSVLLRIMVTLFVNLVIGVIFGYGGYLVYNGIFNVGLLMEFTGYFTSVVWPIMAVAELIDMASRGKASLKRISVLLDTEPDVCDREGAQDVGMLKGEIEFRNLTFTYPGADIPSVRDIDLKIKAGEHIGIIGRTGSGKTTLADLILRQYNVPEGTLFMDGHDVNDITLESIRRSTAYVPQDNFLFSDTIRNNIGFSADGYSDDEISEVAALAGVEHDILEFPDKYDTLLGERGVTVSGGQRQRISIARALVKDASVIVLDDAVSAVDTNTEQVILTSLEEKLKGRTVIMVAHRISTVEEMDRIVYMEDGRIIAAGPHEELLSTCEEYHRLNELQKLDDERGGDHNA